MASPMALSLICKLVHVLVHADGLDVLQRAVVEFGDEPAGELFGLVGEVLVLAAGDAAQRLVERPGAEADRAREKFVEDEKLDHLVRLDLRDVKFAVGVVRAAGAQDGAPLQRAAGVGIVRRAR